MMFDDENMRDKMLTRPNTIVTHFSHAVLNINHENIR